MTPDQRLAVALLALTLAFLLLDGYAYATRRWWHTHTTRHTHPKD